MRKVSVFFLLKDFGNNICTARIHFTFQGIVIDTQNFAFKLLGKCVKINFFSTKCKKKKSVKH